MTAPLTDWDAPELNEAALTKPIDVDNDADSESEHAKDDDDDDEDGGGSDQAFDNWKKRLNIPKMSMHADEEQAKRR